MVRPFTDRLDHILPSDGSDRKCWTPPIPYPHPSCHRSLARVWEKYGDLGHGSAVGSFFRLLVALLRASSSPY